MQRWNNINQLGNKNDLDGHASVNEIIQALYVPVLYTRLYVDIIKHATRDLGKIQDRPVSVSDFGSFLPCF